MTVKNHVSTVYFDVIISKILSLFFLSQWMRLLVSTQRIMLKAGVATFDISACAEASIKAALIIEFICSNNSTAGQIGSRKVSEGFINSSHSQIGLF